MGEENQKAWQEEQLRVDYVIQQIDKLSQRLEGKTGGLKGDIIDIRKGFWDDITVNLDEPDDIIESHASIRQQAEFLSERERTHGQYHRQLKTLERLKLSPYFGRIDFKESGSSETEQVYLGISSLMDDKDENFLIYDWRAPISSLYYDYTPGVAQYETPEGTIRGNMELKRQFIIRNAIIKSMFDTNITIGDELLQEVLGNQADNQMKSIVATIQREQNQIIRNEKSKLLVVQGVAGSGKTSAALQRVAYLLYRYRKTLSSSNILLFSPNPLFNSYVSTVLPELGEENMEQTTFQEYLERELDTYFELEDPFDQLEYALSGDELHYDERMAGIRYKATLDFKQFLDTYIEQLSTEGMRFKNIRFRGKTVISANEIQSFFYSLDHSFTLPNRLEIVRDWLLKSLKKIERNERSKTWVEEEILYLDKEDYVKVYQAIEENDGFSEESFDDHDREESQLRKLVVNRHFKGLIRKVKDLGFLNIKIIYRDFYEKYKEETRFNTPEQWRLICEMTKEALNNKKLYYEDATPFLYLKETVEGKRTNRVIRHVFIDEAQDYTPFQFAYIQGLFPNSKLTVLGDFSQAIYPHTLNLDTLLAQDLYDAKDQDRIELVRSYRSTQEIVEFTKSLLPKPVEIIPFNRHGDKPTLTRCEEENDHRKLLMERIRQLQQKGHQTIAIICKTAKESRKAYEALKAELPVQLMNQETASFNKGILILPAYLAKGIEFDAVVIYDASDKVYYQEAARKLFYTACTRAMHELHLFSIGKESRWVHQVPEDTYVLRFELKG